MVTACTNLYPRNGEIGWLPCTLIEADGSVFREKGALKLTLGRILTIWMDISGEH